MKPTIEDIKFSQEDLEQYKGTINKYESREYRNRYSCNSCDNIATKLVKYQVGDKEQKATRIERYCQRHYELIIKK